MPNIIETLQADVDFLKQQIKELKTENERISNENRDLSNRNTYLESYNANMKVILLRSLGEDEYKNFRKQRHSYT